MSLNKLSGKLKNKHASNTKGMGSRPISKLQTQTNKQTVKTKQIDKQTDTQTEF